VSGFKESPVGKLEENELSSKRWASAPRRPDSPCVLGAPTSREAAGPPVQLEPVDLSVKTPVVLQVPRYSPAAALITGAARRIPSPSTTPTPLPICPSTGESSYVYYVYVYIYMYMYTFIFMCV
ncbi:GSCOCG00002224001-RA-CDS, partial [Cotesia congregata]